MPRLKKKTIPSENVSRLIRGYGVTAVELAEMIDCCRQTASKKLSQPETFTLQELRAVSRSVGIPIDELRQAAWR